MVSSAASRNAAMWPRSAWPDRTRTRRTPERASSERTPVTCPSSCVIVSETVPVIGGKADPHEQELPLGGPHRQEDPLAGAAGKILFHCVAPGPRAGVRSIIALAWAVTP